MKSFKPALLLSKYWRLFESAGRLGSVVDLACGPGRNGLFLAAKGIPVIMIDRSETDLKTVGNWARHKGIRVDIRRLDLEQVGSNPLEGLSPGGMLVFRYLHRPLIPAIRQAIRTGGILMYETFTHEQIRFGKPRNPDFLLQPGELKRWFGDWEILHYFEGIQPDPAQAIAQIICRKKSPD